MMNSGWKWFRLGDYFDVKKGKRLTSEDQTEGNNIYIGAIDSNNGVANYIGQAPIHDGNTISLSYNGSVGEAFYQPEPYWATDDVNALYPKFDNFNRYNGLFVVTILRQEKYKYSYGRKWTLENMEDTEIMLPADSEGNPDWQFMEDYIKSLHYKPITTKNKKENVFELRINEWDEFVLGKIFNVTKAYAYNQDTLQPIENNSDYAIPCVTRTAINNGVDYYGELSEDLRVEQGNALTIGGEGVVCFYQPESFVCGTNMTVLRHDKLNCYNGLFISSVIDFYSKDRFSYGRAFNKGQVEKSIIKLPVDANGNPDWQFMEDYIKSLPYGDRI